VNAQGPNGNTPLHQAAMGSQANAASILLAHGADPRRRNLFGATPLDLAPV
ncbi:unnamed protein product, partial [Discosporangium mesarthrocarpum]